MKISMFFICVEAIIYLLLYIILLSIYNIIQLSIGFELLKYQTVTPKTSSDIVLRLWTGACATCYLKMTISQIQIHQTVEDGSLASISVPEHILNKQNVRQCIYRTKNQNEETINFPR